MTTCANHNLLTWAISSSLFPLQVPLVTQCLFRHAEYTQKYHAADHTSRNLKKKKKKAPKKQILDKQLTSCIEFTLLRNSSQTKRQADV